MSSTRIDGNGAAPLVAGTRKMNGAAGPEDSPPGSPGTPAPTQDAVSSAPQTPTGVKPSDAPSSTLPPHQPDKVEFCEPEQTQPVERTIEVAGAGMGSYKKYSMLESEALAVYTIIRDNKGSVKPEELKKQLKERYGIDAEITRVDGQIALVNKATGNAIAVDTEGNGALGFEDLQFKDALLAAGIDPDRKKPHFNPYDLAMKVITEANDLSKKRQQDEEARAAQRASAASAATKGAPVPAGTAAPGTPTPTPGAAPSPTPASTPSSPPPSSGPGMKSY